MVLIQLLLPNKQPDGTALDRAFAATRLELMDRFGGLTAYQRSPALGAWTNPQGAVERDDVVMVEVVTGGVRRRLVATVQGETTGAFLPERDTCARLGYRAAMIQQLEAAAVTLLGGPKTMARQYVRGKGPSHSRGTPPPARACPRRQPCPPFSPGAGPDVDHPIAAAPRRAYRARRRSRYCRHRPGRAAGSSASRRLRDAGRSSVRRACRACRRAAFAAVPSPA